MTASHRLNQDARDRVTFDEVTTGGLQMEADLQPGHAAGILESEID